MKYLNVILTIIAILLAAITARIYHIETLLMDANESVPMMINSDQAVMNSQERLNTGIMSLKKQLEVVSDKLLSKVGPDKKGGAQ